GGSRPWLQQPTLLWANDRRTMEYWTRAAIKRSWASNSVERVQRIDPQRSEMPQIEGQDHELARLGDRRDGDIAKPGCRPSASAASLSTPAIRAAARSNDSTRSA